MSLLPAAIDRLIEAFGLLPGVGPRTAERYAYYLVKSPSNKADKLSRLIGDLHNQVKYCPITFALIDKDQEVSSLYNNPDREKQLVAVVAEPFDIVAIEKTGSFKGTYHVLGGLVSPIDGVNPEDLNIESLINRIVTDEVKEIILAISADVEGETTSLIIQKQIQDQQLDIKVTRLARGIPVGVDIEYADQMTLSRALEGRTSV